MTRIHPMNRVYRYYGSNSSCGIDTIKRRRTYVRRYVLPVLNFFFFKPKNDTIMCLKKEKKKVPAFF